MFLFKTILRKIWQIIFVIIIHFFASVFYPFRNSPTRRKTKQPTAVYDFVHPKTGNTHWLLLPTVTLDCMEIALKNFAKEINQDNFKEIVIMIDQAGFHKISKCRIPQGLHLYFLTQYTPELQPAEPL